jgi:DNA-binding transcriptional regulator YiaG
LLTLIPQRGTERQVFFLGVQPKISKELPVDSKEFLHYRKKLNKTQIQMAQVLGTSLKAIHSYEQGWRRVPPYVERQLLFLYSRRRGANKNRKACWVIKKCPPERKKRCPAWEFDGGTLCWFISGTICEGTPHKNWQEKIKVCQSCEVFTSSM